MTKEIIAAARNADNKSRYFALCCMLVAVAVTASIALSDQSLLHRSVIGFSKFLATFAIALYAFLSLSHTSLKPKAAVFLIMGLASESLCDFMIEFNFVLGGTFSILGMLCYSLSFLQYRDSGGINARRAILVAIPAFALTAMFFAAQAIVLQLTAGEFLVATDGVFLIYMLILSLTAALSYGYRAPFALRAAITLFYLSDYIVYFQMALGHRPSFRIANAFLYYGAQAMFVFFAFNARGADRTRASGE